MARIRNLKLEVQLNGGQNDKVTAVVDYDIEFSDVDRNENVRYREQARLIGDDTNVPGDIANGDDDHLVKMFDQITETAGQLSVHRHLEKKIPRSKANEDPGTKDELRAEVRLRHVQGQLKPEFAQSKPVVVRF